MILPYLGKLSQLDNNNNKLLKYYILSSIMLKKQQIKHIILTAILMTIGLIIFKHLPEYVYGNNILFDASQHVTITIFVLYVLYFFIDQNKSWKIPYFIFSAVVIIIISIQRIYSNHHNEIGILLALLISTSSILISHYKYFKNKLKF